MSEASSRSSEAKALPPPLDRLAGREFSFYPSIENVPQNLWRLVDANWSEFLVENALDQSQLWVPRRYLGDVSSTDKPVMIVGLNRPLESKAGQVWPVQKRVIEMPRVPSSLDAATAQEIPVAVEGMLSSSIRLDASEKKVGRLVLLALGAALVVVSLAVLAFRYSRSGEMVQFKGVVQESLGLGPEDDYFAVVRKLGPPSEDRFKQDAGSVHFRLLRYPNRKLYVILSGREQAKANYIGAMDLDWKVVDSVTQKGGSTTYAVLSRLPRF